MSLKRILYIKGHHYTDNRRQKYEYSTTKHFNLQSIVSAPKQTVSYCTVPYT